MTRSAAALLWRQAGEFANGVEPPPAVLDAACEVLLGYSDPPTRDDVRSAIKAAMRAAAKL